MNAGTRSRLSWLLNRRAGVAALWVLLVTVIALAVNIAGIHAVGSISAWERWLHAHSHHFMVWRLLLYGATAWAWWWMRSRLRRRETAIGANARLLRTEIAAVATIMLLEGSQLVAHALRSV
jgi:hypothetical protein